jgi:hypothetical protein
MPKTDAQCTQNTQVCYTQLPPELWFHILSFLMTPDLLKTAYLSRVFYKLSIPIIYEKVRWTADADCLFATSASSKMLVEQVADDASGGRLLHRVRECIISRGIECEAVTKEPYMTVCIVSVRRPCCNR